VVLKDEPLGSLREEFLIPGRNFVPGRNWGGKAVDEKTLSFYYYFIQHIKTVRLGWFRCECLHYASTSCFIITIVWASCFSPLLGRTRSQGRCWAANGSSQSGRAIHGEVDGLDIGRQHGQQFDLLRHTHRPQKWPYHLCKHERKRLTPVQKRLNRTHAVLGRAIPRGWVRDESTAFRSVLQPFHSPSVIRPERYTSFIVVR